MRLKLRGLALASVSVAAASLILSLPVGAKEGVKATLTKSIPLDASAGAEVTVAWRLFSVGESGQREPFGANGVFVRLTSASGAQAEEAFASDRHATGEYEAIVVVPEGGIGDVEIGVLGWRSDVTGTRRADAIFPITNEPVPRVGRVFSPVSLRPAPEPREAGSPPWAFLVIAGGLSTLALLALAVGVRYKRGGVAAADRTVRERVPSLGP